MIIQKEIRNLINEVSKELDLPFNTVRDIFYSQFDYIRKEIEKGKKGNFDSFSNILLRYFGTFYASEAKINNIEKAKKNKDEKRN